MTVPPLDTHDGRRAWSFLALLGGCLVMTGFAAVGVYLVSGNATYSFWLAIAAHVQIIVGLSFFGWSLGRRLQASLSKDGVTLNDAGASDA